MTRSAEDRVPLAIDLGWRMAELFALNLAYEPMRKCQLLPSRNSLERRDRLELELLAAAGTARRLGIDLPQEQLDQVRALAERAAAREGADEEFREELERCHIRLDKQLWTQSEAEGRAYELGIMLSDTYNRIHRAYHKHHPTPHAEWLAVFDKDRTETLKTLLDNLQSRLEPGAVTVVRDQVNAWDARVNEVLVGQPNSWAPEKDALGELRSQAIVWRQLLTGDKEPEAFLGPDARARVRDELVHLMWRRYWSWVVGLFAALFSASVLLLVLHPNVGGWYSAHTRDAALVTSVVVSLMGALGISKASINRAIKDNLRTWSTLLWNRAVAIVVCGETLRVDLVFPKPPPRRTQLVYAWRQWLGSTLSDSATSAPSATPHESSAGA